MEVKINGIYRHFKGDQYLVEDIAYHCDNLEPHVIYRALYGDNKLYIRPLKSFTEETNRGNQKYRFEYVENPSVKDNSL